jgi:flavin reductase (DIM6/NTAB) family NADH-FMN oxidoreductase RutF
MTSRHKPDPAGLRLLYGCFPTGVAAVGALIDGRPVGMAASSFTAVSLTPALVSVAVQNTSRTWQLLRDADHLGITILSGTQAPACRQLSLRDGDRFAGVGWSAEPGGAVFIDGGICTLDCTMHAELDAGDHIIALFAVHSYTIERSSDPLVFHGSSFKQLAAS